jgi:hypothetical protein
MATDHLQATINQVQALSVEEQLQLIKYLLDKLAEHQPKGEPRHLVTASSVIQQPAECPPKKISKSLNGIR